MKEHQDEYESLMKIIRGRRSIRHYTPDRLERDLILKLIDAARYAPSATNLQPWLFLIIDKDEVKEEMAQAVLQKLQHTASREEMIGDKNIREFWQDYSLFFRRAPVIIAPLCRPYPETIRLGYESLEEELERKRLLGIESTCVAVQNLLLAAHAVGLGGCWMDGALVAKKEIEEILEVRSPWELMCLVTIGYPDEHPHPPRRKRVELIARFIS